MIHQNDYGETIVHIGVPLAMIVHGYWLLKKTVDELRLPTLKTLGIASYNY